MAKTKAHKGRGMGNRDRQGKAGKVKGGSVGGKAQTARYLDEVEAIKGDATNDYYKDLRDHYDYYEYLDEEAERERQETEEGHYDSDSYYDSDRGDAKPTRRCRDCGVTYRGGPYEDWCDSCEYGDWLAANDPETHGMFRSRGLEKERNYDAAMAVLAEIDALTAQIRKKWEELGNLPHHVCVGTDWDVCDAPVPKAGDKCDYCASGASGW